MYLPTELLPPPSPFSSPAQTVLSLGPPVLNGFLDGVLGGGGSGGGGGGNGTHGDHPGDELPSNWSPLIGIVTAIVGNVLIALALNVQRYAHIRLHKQRAHFRERAKQALKNASNGGGATGRGEEGGQSGNAGAGAGYGSVGRNGSGNGSANRSANGNGNGNEEDGNYRNDETEAHESDPLAASYQSGDSRWSEESGEGGEGKTSSSYLKSPYWWLGQVLIIIGEMGNFLAYGFAPASIVSPLGVVALISNCVIAPILFKEKFRQRDFWGVLVAIAGVVTVVLSAKTQEMKLEPHDVWDAITTTAFEVYLGITCFLIAVLMWASPRYGNRTILIDLGLVGLYGGYTVLATKGVSSMLSSTLFAAFATPVTWALLAILLGTAVMQVRYVNKALQRFDSTQVIPIQFVMFTLCVILGSAVLYRDFERTTAEQAVKFVGGCLLTFFGVFLITSGRSRSQEEEESFEQAEGIGETIGLSEQGPGTPQHQGGPHSRRESEDQEAGRSRRSSRASRVSFAEAHNRPLDVLTNTGVPTLRTPTAAGTSRTSLPSEDSEPSFFPPGTLAVHPGTGIHAVSADSVPTLSVIGSSGPGSEVATPLSQSVIPSFPAASPNDRPVTPRTSGTYPRPHSHHFQGTMISPSPLSSTVSAVVGDTLLKHMDNPQLHHALSRRSRHSLRSSLFVPQEELDLEEDDSETEPDATLPPGADEAADDDEEGLPGAERGGSAKRRSVRGRAKSLTHTLGELFRVGRKRRNTSEDGSVGALPSQSTETL